MANWKSANMAALLPPGMTEIFTTMDAVITVVKTPLDAVSSILNIAKVLLIGLAAWDPSSVLRNLVIDFKNDLLGSGYFVCDMWDYPQKQLKITDNGPTGTYDTLNFLGNPFVESFITDLVNSFDDLEDMNRPQTKGRASILLLVRAHRNLDSLNVFPEEGNVAEIFEGKSAEVKHTAYAIQGARWRGAMGKVRKCAELQELSKAPSRVARVQKALRIINQLPPDVLDTLKVPTTYDSGERFFEDVEPEDINWEDDVVQVLESIEANLATATYPDWKRSQLRDIHPLLVDAVNAIFDPIIDMLKPGIASSEQIVDLITAIENKIIVLESLLAKIDEFIYQLDILINATGFYALYASTDGGIPLLRSKIVSAGSVPFDENMFFSGMAIVAEGNGSYAFDALFGPIGS